jgi:type I restriction enzyme, S subunit
MVDYKQTDVGLIPVDWEVKKLEMVANFSNGKAHELFINENGGYIVVNSKFISTQGKVVKYSYKNFHPLKTGDITMVMSDIPNGKALAKCYLIPKENKYALNQRICSIRVTNCNNIFLSYLLNRNKYYLSFDSGTGQTNLKKQDVVSCPIPLPPLPEQEAIAEVLSDTDELIGALEKRIAKKQLVKQGAMQTLLTPQDDWEVKKLPDVCWFQEGPGVRKSQFTLKGVKLLNGTNIEKGKLLLDKTERYVSEKEAYGWYSHFLVDNGDILIACSGVSIDKFHEKVTIADNNHLPLCMNTSTMRFKIKTSTLIKSYLIHFLKSKDFKQQISGKATGSAQLNFGPSHVSKLLINLPPIEEQTSIATILSDMDNEIDALEKKLSKTKKLKLGLMQQLLIGKIRLA